MNLQIGVPRGYCYAHAIEPTDNHLTTVEKRLLQDNSSLILNHCSTILTVAEYFFCPLSFAYCITGIPGAVVLSCALRLGHLLIGWRHGALVERCPKCNGEAFITTFGGNLKSAIMWSEALCIGCRELLRFPSSREATSKRIEVVRRIVKRFPEFLEEIEHFAAYSFSWSGCGLGRATKSRIVSRQLYSAVPFDVLIYELQKGALRQRRPPVISLSQEELRRKFQTSTGYRG